MNSRGGRAIAAAAASVADEFLEITVTLFRPTSSASSLGLELIVVDEEYPPAVYNIEKRTPAAKCRQIKVGDIITDINKEDVQEYSIKKVLKCLELAQNPITLKLVRDPAIVNKVHDQLNYEFSRKALNEANLPLLQRQPPSSEMVTKANLNTIKISNCKSFTKTEDRVIKLSINVEFTLPTKKDQETHDIGENGSSIEIIENKKNYYHDKKNNNDIHYTPNNDFDFDFLHSSRFSKVVDIPSASRLAKRLFYLEGFKKSDVSYHLKKKDEFSKAVAEKYWTYFEFKYISLDIALRTLFNKMTLTALTKEEEKLVADFSNRYIDCNPQCLYSRGALHSLCCNVLQLNSILQDPKMRPKITCDEFIRSMTGLNNKTDFPIFVLRSLYNEVNHTPLEWAIDYDLDENQLKNGTQPIDDFGEMSEYESHENVLTQDSVYKTGHLSRKNCFEPFGKKTLIGKRSWKMYYCELFNQYLHLNKCNSECHESSNVDGFHENIFLLHGLATRATDYTKKQNVFRLVTADQSEYLFETNDCKELFSWIDAINFACARFSSPGLPSVDGNHRKFQRPLLPSAPTTLNLQEQLCEYEDSYQKLNDELHNHQKQTLECGIALLQYNEEKETYLHEELRRHEVYINVLKSKMIKFSKHDSSVKSVEDEC